MNLEPAPVIGADQIALLEKLSNACAVSGDEGEVRAIVLEQIKPVCDDVKIDALGNILAIRKSKIDQPMRVMIASHMDEVGFMLVEEDEGMFRFGLVGGINPRYLIGKQVWVGKEHNSGVIGAKPIHLTTADERKNQIPVDTLRIDMGLEGKSKAKPGQRATFATKFRQSGPSLMGKALDNRLGVATLVELIKHAPANIELLAAFTVQEEVGLRGARVAGYAMNPDLAIALDSTPANDLPVWDDSENHAYNTKLDHGPAIYSVDGRTLSDPRLVRYLIKTADAHGTPFQLRQPGGGGTDAGSIHLQKAGIPSVSVSVPSRYTHTPVGLARLKDWQNTLSLLYFALAECDRTIFEEER